MNLLVAVSISIIVSGVSQSGGGAGTPSCGLGDLTCSVADGNITLNWTLQGADCRCEVRDATGSALGTPAPGDTTFRVSCTSLGSPTGTLSVVCMDSTGQEQTATCEYDCNPCQLNVDCQIGQDNQGNPELFFFYEPTNCDCRFLELMSGGTLIQELSPDESMFSALCRDLPVGS